MIDEIYKGYTIIGSEETGIVSVDPHGHFSSKVYTTYEEAIKDIDEDVKNSVEVSETSESEKLAEIVDYPYKKTSYGKYFFRDDLQKRICDVFKIEYHICSHMLIIHTDEQQEIEKIEKLLVAAKMIKFSKSGNMFIKC